VRKQKQCEKKKKKKEIRVVPNAMAMTIGKVILCFVKYCESGTITHETNQPMNEIKMFSSRTVSIAIFSHHAMPQRRMAFPQTRSQEGQQVGVLATAGSEVKDRYIVIPIGKTKQNKNSKKKQRKHKKRRN
jgi:hypothetical protein